jgi:hypothetical protein
MSTVSRPTSVTVESLLAEIQALPAEGEPRRLELWIPDALTLRAEPVPNDVGIAVVLDALLAKSFLPGGVQVEAGGRLCRYVRE